MQKNQFSNQQFNPSHSQSNRIALPEYSGATSDNRIQPGVGARALVSAGMLVLTVWTVSLFSDGSNAYSDTSASQPVAAPVSLVNISSEQAEDKPLDLPPLNSKVICSKMRMYHWQRDCPLNSATSLRHPSRTDDVNRQEQHLTRRAAELQNYYPCRYCVEIKEWRARHHAAKK